MQQIKVKTNILGLQIYSILDLPDTKLNEKEIKDVVQKAINSHIDAFLTPIFFAGIKSLSKK